MSPSSSSGFHTAALRLPPSAPSHRRSQLRPCLAVQAPTMPAALPFQRCSFDKISPIEAILFRHRWDSLRFRPDPLLRLSRNAAGVGYNNGEPITEEFFSKNISGGHNDDLVRFLFPDWNSKRAAQFMDDKEAMFRRIAAEKLKPLLGLKKLCDWIDDRQLKRAAVTNAPRANAELILSIVGLSEFFPVLVIGSECERAKPFPDPYLKALDLIGATAAHTFVFEDSASGIKAGVAAGMPVVGMKTRNAEEILMNAGASFLIEDFEDEKLWKALEEDETERVAAALERERTEFEFK